MNFSTRAISSALGFCAVLMVATESVGGVGNFCPFGPCLPDHETIINLYWDSSTTQWDSDVGGTATGLTVAQLDTFTRALVNSSYFSQLAQYHVDHIYMGPTLTAADCTATPSAAMLPANVDAAISGIDGLIGCIAQTNPVLQNIDAAIINVFLPPQVVNTGFCNVQPDGSRAAAEHDGSSVSNRLLWTVIPTTSACTGSLTAVTTALSHEIVEAATDPVPQSPSGWKEIGGREIADFCSLSTAYTFASATQYWSNSANMCVSGFGSGSAPTISTATVCGTGRWMQITLNGSFGHAPWDLGAGSRSLYVRAQVATPGSAWKAGNMLAAPPDTVAFANLAWTPGIGPNGSDVIRIRGFDSGYGGAKSVRPGDTLTITVENPDTAVRATTMVTAPAASAVRAFSVAPDLTPNATSGITGFAVDSSGCGVEGALIRMVATGGVVDPTDVTTASDGIIVSKFTAPEVAGSVTINVTGVPFASATTRVHPRIDSLVQPRGDVAGGVSTIVNGLGFDNSTKVSFGGNPAVMVAAAPNHKSATLNTPASTSGPGRVAVVASVNNISSSPSQYEYIVSGVPVIEFVDATGTPITKPTCNVGQIRVQIFNVDGTPRTGTALLSASYPAFWTGRPLRWSSSISAPLGSVVTISGGGPITAADAANPANKTTASFPVWPSDLCGLVKSVDKKVSKIVRIPQLYAFTPRCEGDCGNAGPAVVIWADAQDLTRARNYVSIRGRSVDEIKARYKVETIADEAQDTLVADNPFVALRTSTEGRAAFVGQMVSITGDGSANFAHVSFDLPDSTGTYAIVHLRLVGKRQAWIEEKGAEVTRNRTTIETDVASTGVYALVRVEGTAGTKAE